MVGNPLKRQLQQKEISKWDMWIVILSTDPEVVMQGKVIWYVAEILDPGLAEIITPD